MACNLGLYLRDAVSFRSLLSLQKALLKCLEKLHCRSSTDTASISSERLVFLAAGKSGCVYGIDNQRVVKEYYESASGEVERRAYCRLGSHPNIVKLLETRKDGSITLERGIVLRKLCQDRSAKYIPIRRKLFWLRQAAKGYKHIHDCGIAHGDVGCNNMILTKRIWKEYVKIIDFEGCSIDGEPADSCYEWFSHRRATPQVSRQTDIFAFGCAIYEVITGRPPYHELEASNDRDREVEELYLNDCFPDVTSLPLGQLIWGCWHGRFESMGEIIRELELEHKRLLF